MIVAAEPGLAAGPVSPDHGRRRGPFSTQNRGPVSMKIDILRNHLALQRVRGGQKCVDEEYGVACVRHAMSFADRSVTIPNTDLSVTK